jgi:hypothetical protein
MIVLPSLEDRQQSLLPKCWCSTAGETCCLKALNLPLGQENAGWDGVFKGKVLGTGVYTYMAEVRFIDGEVILYEGDISIVR